MLKVHCSANENKTIWFELAGNWPIFSINIEPTKYHHAKTTICATNIPMAYRRIHLHSVHSCCNSVTLPHMHVNIFSNLSLHIGNYITLSSRDDAIAGLQCHVWGADPVVCDTWFTTTVTGNSIHLPKLLILADSSDCTWKIRSCYGTSKTIIINKIP